MVNIHVVLDGIILNYVYIQVIQFAHVFLANISTSRSQIVRSLREYRAKEDSLLDHISYYYLLFETIWFVNFLLFNSFSSGGASRIKGDTKVCMYV